MFDPAVFATRRDAAMRALGDKAVAVVCSLPERLRNGDSYYRFRQVSDLVYLTGFLEPETTLVLRPGAEQERVVMFVRPRDPEAERWEGKRAGVEGATERYGAETAYPAAELATRLPDLVANADELHYALGVDEHMDAVIGATIARLRRTERKGKRPPRALVDPRVVLHELRLRKAPEELAVLKRAAAITCEAHLAAMRAGRPGAFEHEVEAVIDYTFRSRGGGGPGYATIVGAGENATVLHYIANRSAIRDGDLVLVDAGCELDHYTADVTRTWPASGKFSPAQRRVYELVLAAQQAVIELARPGATIDQLHQCSVRRLTEGLIDLGVLPGAAEDRIADQSYRRFFMHGTSHWLGLDVHDAGAYMPTGVHRALEPNMVITVEPGLYFAADAYDLPEEFRGIGVRIEDDLAITAGAPEVLTAACPKQIEDIEAACR
jgi:Xaa-Pro aminopeptidase